MKRQRGEKRSTVSKGDEMEKIGKKGKERDEKESICENNQLCLIYLKNLNNFRQAKKLNILYLFLCDKTYRIL
jgi:hypothetical protein